MSATLRLLAPHLWPAGRPGLRARALVAALLLVVSKLALVSVPVLLRHGVDRLGESAAGPVVVPVALLLGYGAALLLASGLDELRDAVFVRVVHHAAREICVATLRHLYRLPLAFHLDRQPGALARILDRGGRAIEGLIYPLVFYALPTLIEVALACAVLWATFAWTYAAIVALTVLVYLGLTVALTERRVRYRRASNQANNRVNAIAVDGLGKVETVKVSGAGEREVERYAAEFRAYTQTAQRSYDWLALLHAGQSLTTCVGVTTIMLLAADAVAREAMTIGGFVMVNAYLIQLIAPISRLSGSYRTVKHALIDLEALLALLELEPAICDAPEARALGPGPTQLCFRDVEFGYDPRRPILRGVSFCLAPGRTLAVVGPSGSGKSTLVRLILRLYEVDGGSVSLGGHDLRSLRQRDLRAAVAVVGQDTALFNDTLAYNIRYARPQASAREFDQALRDAALAELVERLPEGDQTMVGARGLKLSGGEAQRVAIARAVLERPSLFIFDEASAALDAETAAIVHARLRAVSAGTATLIVSHRLIEVRDADEILVLDAGRIVERGRHEQLLAAGRLYASMWRQQQAAEPSANPAVPASMLRACKTRERARLIGAATTPLAGIR